MQNLFNLEVSTFNINLYKMVTRLVGQKSFKDIEANFFGIKQISTEFVHAFTIYCSKFLRNFQCYNVFINIFRFFLSIVIRKPTLSPESYNSTENSQVQHISSHHYTTFQSRLNFLLQTSDSKTSSPALNKSEPKVPLLLASTLHTIHCI